MYLKINDDTRINMDVVTSYRVTKAHGESYVAFNFDSMIMEPNSNIGFRLNAYMHKCESYSQAEMMANQIDLIMSAKELPDGH